MADVFMFSAQPEVNKVEKPPDLNFCAKRARPIEADVSGDSLRKPMAESFKSKLLNASSPDNWQGFGAGKGKFQIEEGDVMVEEGPAGPVMKLSEGLKEKLCKPWENALILKNMGRPHTLNFMLSKLKQKWPLIGHWQVTDIDDGYFIARFQMREDMETVLTGGPWVIANQYLAVQRWRPNFVPGEDTIKRMMVWVRLSKLPVEWIDAGLLYRIGGMLGSTVKVDPITETQARGRFARICVEIDIMKPLRSFLEVENRAVKVEYENLGLICFKCGRFGHSKEVCKEDSEEMRGMSASADELKAKASMGHTGNGSEKDPYGPWMQVSYGRFNRNQLGNNSTGRRHGGQSSGSKQVFGARQNSGLSTVNSESYGHGKHVESGQINEEPAKVSMKVAPVKRNGKMVASEVFGSRFDILNEIREEELCDENRQEKMPSKSVLAEISNKEVSTKKITKTNVNKYLVDQLTPTGRPAKENGKESWVRKTGKGGKKSVVQMHNGKKNSVQLDAVIEDSDVLQSLHQKMVEIRVAESQQVAETEPPDDGQPSIVLSDETNFDIVASKLKEAMEIVLE